jgi:Protein of unknown function (DUF2867)
MKVQSVVPAVDTHSLLTGAQFSDAFSAGLDARQAAERMLGHQSRWIVALMALRHRLVAPLGLKTSAPAGTADTIGIFPILSETPDRLIAGLNDQHLDFRVVVDVIASGETQRVTATTLVKTHNRLGRVYLAVVLPFHRLIVRALLRQVAA